MAEVWDRRVGSWHEHVMSGPVFERIRGEVLRAAAPREDDECVDLGAGTGFLALELAGRSRSVLAVDIAPAMLTALQTEAAARGLDNVDVRTADIASLMLAPASVDVVVSNYALHHLSHVHKRLVLNRAFRWLRPHGRLVVADMMFGRGFTAHDQQIFRDKSRALLGHGPAGAWRVVKNSARIGLGVGSERPASPAFYLRAAENAGFASVRYQRVEAEAGLLTAVRPARGDSAR
jgi:ubiquinone/menaquinone biosynthesis C-methylase UbiE